MKTLSLLILVLIFFMSAQAQRKEVNRAFIYETFLPGAGLYYAGEYKEAVFSFTISAGLSYMIVYDRAHGLTGRGWVITLLVFRWLEILNATQRITFENGRIRIGIIL